MVLSHWDVISIRMNTPKALFYCDGRKCIQPMNGAVLWCTCIIRCVWRKRDAKSQPVDCLTWVDSHFSLPFTNQSNSCSEFFDIEPHTKCMYHDRHMTTSTNEIQTPPVYTSSVINWPQHTNIGQKQLTAFNFYIVIQYVTECDLQYKIFKRLEPVSNQNL